MPENEPKNGVLILDHEDTMYTLSDNKMQEMGDPEYNECIYHFYRDQIDIVKSVNKEFFVEMDAICYDGYSSENSKHTNYFEIEICKSPILCRPYIAIGCRRFFGHNASELIKWLSVNPSVKEVLDSYMKNAKVTIDDFEEKLPFQRKLSTGV